MCVSIRVCVVHGNDFLIHYWESPPDNWNDALTHEFPCYHSGKWQLSAPTQFQSVLTPVYKSSSHSDSQYQPLEVHLIPLNYRWQERKLQTPSFSLSWFPVRCNPIWKGDPSWSKDVLGWHATERDTSHCSSQLLAAVVTEHLKKGEKGGKKETLGTETEQLGCFVSHRSVEDWFRLLSKLLELIETSVSSLVWHHECWNCEKRLWLLRLVRKCIAHQTSCRVSTLN